MNAPRSMTHFSATSVVSLRAKRELASSTCAPARANARGSGSPLRSATWLGAPPHCVSHRHKVHTATPRTPHRANSAPRTPPPRRVAALTGCMKTLMACRASARARGRSHVPLSNMAPRTPPYASRRFDSSRTTTCTGTLSTDICSFGFLWCVWFFRAPNSNLKKKKKKATLKIK